ncbi:MAG: polyprenyl synthetase family protein [Planctomycetaceae bacterium]|jgi:octaprenyl-diphosphate synthase|nr:polyprenyl synthetase family protein [Planctomycetaceae bacterium]
MLQSSDSFSTVPQNLDSAYQVIASELKHLENLMREELSSNIAFVDDVVRYAFRLGGKRLRPSLLLLIGKTLAPIVPEHFLLASAIELIHTATLIHDDILDGAEIRRHLQTMNHKWNAEVSVMAGDYLLAKSMEMVTRLDNIDAYRILSTSCRETCYGELYQLGTCSQFHITLMEYEQMIAAKTAALIESACHLGAVYAGASESTIRVFRNFGKNLGMAFQMVDDVLDIVGEESQMGKTLGTDLVKKKPTLPLILFLESLEAAERKSVTGELLIRSGDRDFVAEIAARIKNSGSTDAAMNLARNLILDAVAQIETIPLQEIVSSEAFQSLVTIARFVVERKI